MEFECRTCLKVSDNLLDLFSSDLPIKIQVISSLEILEKEKFPSKICEECANNVRFLYDFRETIAKSNEILEERCSKSDFVKTYDEIIIKNEDDAVDETKDVTVSERVPENIILFDRNKKNRVYECSLCDFTTTLYKVWRRHRSVHEGVAKVTCDVCGVLVRKDNIDKHKLIHTSAPVSCKICNKVCKNKEVLRHHITRHNNPPSEFQCIECGKMYASKSSHNIHVKRHKLDSKTEMCSMCPKRFFDKKTLAAHIRSHTGERPYPCQYCKKGFSSGYALKTHIRQHTNERPFACSFCDTAFPQKVSLKTHIKAKHPDKII